MDSDLRRRLHDWMFAEALPFWADEGLDRVHGGCVESFALHGRAPSGVGYKRTRVACRQIYVFSHAAMLGWSGAQQASDHLAEALYEKFWQGPDEGWPRTLTTSGEVLDPADDLYDYAFALFALGWRYKAFGDKDALKLAHRTLDILETRLRHPSGSGFHHQLPAAPLRQQNPHMHLIEAAIVLAEASGESRFYRLANEIADLFLERIVRPTTGALPEVFEDDWTPVAGDQGRWIEPGHQFEWAWILAQHQRLTGRDHTAMVRALVDFAESYGVDPDTQLTFNGVRDDGIVLDRGSRTWPNTERMKGWIGLHDLTGEDPTPALEGSARLLFERYLEPAPPALWLDSYDAAGAPDAPVVPTSTLYHVFLAFAEALRFAPAEATTARAGVAA